MHTHICRDKDTDSETGRRTHAQAREFEWALRQAPSSKGRTLSPVVIELCVADHAALKSIPSVVALAGRLVKIVRMSQGRTYHSGSASILAWRERRDRIQIFGIAPDPGFCSGRALRKIHNHYMYAANLVIEAATRRASGLRCCSWLAACMHAFGRSAPRRILGSPGAGPG